MEHHPSFRKLFKGWRTYHYFGRNLGRLNSCKARREAASSDFLKSDFGPLQKPFRAKLVSTPKPKEGAPADADQFTQTASPEANEFGHTVAA
jgi:hypothetical protein